MHHCHPGLHFTSQRTFIINNNEKENVDEIQLIVKAKNINTKVEDKFTLFLDPENGEKISSVA